MAMACAVSAKLDAGLKVGDVINVPLRDMKIRISADDASVTLKHSGEKGSVLLVVVNSRVKSEKSGVCRSVFCKCGR